MTYNEYIYDICTNTDVHNVDSVTYAMQILAHEAIGYHSLAMKYEDKLQEIMSYKDFAEWSTDMAKEMFLEDVKGMADSDYKDFVLEHFDEITEDGEIDD